MSLSAVVAVALLAAPGQAQNRAVSAEVIANRIVEQVAVQVQEATTRAEARRRPQRERRRIVSSEISVSRNEAKLSLEMQDGEDAEFSIRDGHAWFDGDEIGEAERSGALDQSWRELLNRAMDASSDELPELLASWNPPGNPELDRRLEAVLDGLSPDVAANVSEAQSDDGAQLSSDSVDRLRVRISELRRQVERLESDRVDIPVHVQVTRRGGGGNWFTNGPFRHVIRGVSGVFSMAILFGVIFAIAFATISFGGRRYIEGVADTARAATTRSLLVGLAATFLLIPAFVLGIIALAISIVGIPALLVWVPFFPVAVGLAILLGYIGVAHAAGESLAERRFYATDWFQRGNSYYFLISGLGLLLAPFIAMNVVRMAGPWLGFLTGILAVAGVVATWAALSVGLGAVLLSRGGSRPIRGPGRPSTPEPEIYAEPTGA